MNLRIPVLEWSWRTGALRHHKLEWVDTTLTERGRSFVQTPDGRFRHVPYGAFLPSSMVRAAAEAAERGEPTALEGLLLLFARVEWLVAARPWLFTPFTAVPRLLVSLVEAYGIPSELHKADPSTLAALLAHLPRWYPYRGRFDRAVALLEAACDETPMKPASSQRELFACHGTDWWVARGAVAGPLVIEGGVVLHAAGEPQAEDVRCSGPAQDERFPAEMLRLLPVWVSVRLAPAGEGS